MSELYQSLSHSKWDCKYHVVFVPKRRRKVILGKTRQHLGPIFHALVRTYRIFAARGHLHPGWGCALTGKSVVAKYYGQGPGRSRVERP